MHNCHLGSLTKGGGLVSIPPSLLDGLQFQVLLLFEGHRRQDAVPSVFALRVAEELAGDEMNSLGLAGDQLVRVAQRSLMFSSLH